MIDPDIKIIPNDKTTKLIMKQLKIIMNNPHSSIHLDATNLYIWKVIIDGPSGTPYNGGKWMLRIWFNGEYPSEPPLIKFITPIKHCNINNYGRICHSILSRNYIPTINMSVILDCIYGLLLNPDTADPLDTNLAMAYYNADGSYEAQIIEYTKLYSL